MRIKSITERQGKILDHLYKGCSLVSEQQLKDLGNKLLPGIEAARDGFACNLNINEAATLAASLGLALDTKRLFDDR